MSPLSDGEYDEAADEVWLEPVEAADDDLPDEVIEADAPQTSFWGWLRGLLSEPVGYRLEELTAAIARNPNAPSNYVLRGEVYMETGDYALAADDFDIARALAAEQFEQDHWGLLSQALRDQAEQGLERARRKLARKQKRQP